MLTKLTGCFLVLACLGLVSGQVIELDDSFEEKRLEKPWLVMFYAPWCGHCKKLEPTYHQVYLKLRQVEPKIRVAKLDATRWGSIASAYGVRGYPTIKFIQADLHYTFAGDRSQDGIVEFARRASGPQVRPLTNTGKFNDFRSDHSDQVFFFYVGGESGSLYKKYEELAEKYAVLTYFTIGETRVLPSAVQVKQEPTVLVFKDSKFYEFPFPENEEDNEAALEEWINGERFRAFPKVLGGALNEFSEIQKKLVITVIDDKDKHRELEMNRMRDMAETCATRHRYKYHHDYQFIWMGEKETIDSITMMDVSVPFIIVLDPVSQYYYLPMDSMADMTLDTLEAFLMDVREGKSTPFGGTGFTQRVKRIFYGIYTTLYGYKSAGFFFGIRKWMWDIYFSIYQIYDESAWLALLIFGVPTFVISIVCYALCCMEPFDEDALYGELDSDDDYDDELDTSERKPLMDGDGHMKKE